MPASARRSSMVTPLQAVLSFDQVVTQWMSRVILVWGRALNSSQLQVFTLRGPTFSVKVQLAGATRGVGPAESTGKSSVSDWPGGMRSAISEGGRRPVKPLVTIDPTVLSELREILADEIAADTLRI